MSFPLAINAHPDSSKLNAWYADLCKPVVGCIYTANNLGRCDLFPIADPIADAELTEFAARLPAPLGARSSKARWAQASNGPTGGKVVCVTCGPEATTAPARLVRTLPLSGLLSYCLTEITGVVNSTDLAQFMLADPNGAEAVRPFLLPDAVVRGELRVAFWADKDAVDGFRAINNTAVGLRRYLGIEDGATGPGPLLVMTLDDSEDTPRYRRTVPTGFAAFDSPYFIPQPPGSTVGVAQNIVLAGQPGFRQTEACEVVTSEVDFRHVRFEPTPIL